MRLRATITCVDRGEFHTFAWSGPMFAAPGAVEAGEVVTREGFVFVDLLAGAAAR